jgi:chromosome segregation ATPase
LASTASRLEFWKFLSRSNFLPIKGSPTFCQLACLHSSLFLCSSFFFLFSFFFHLSSLTFVFTFLASFLVFCISSTAKSCFTSHTMATQTSRTSARAAAHAAQRDENARDLAASRVPPQRVFRELTEEEAAQDPALRAFFLTTMDVQDDMMRKATGNQTAIATSHCVQDITPEYTQLQGRENRTELAIHQLRSQLQDVLNRIPQLEATIQQQAATIPQLEATIQQQAATIQQQAATIQDLSVQVQRIPQLEATMVATARVLQELTDQLHAV